MDSHARSFFTVGDIKNAVDRIMQTADIIFNTNVRRIISPCYNSLIPMESALVAWIVECSKINVVLNGKVVRSKALSLFKLFADIAISDKLCEAENNIGDLQPRNRSFRKCKKSFSASYTGYGKFMKR